MRDKKLLTRTINGILEKLCFQCKKFKNLDEFNLDARKKFYRSSWCKECKSEKSKTGGSTRYHKKYGIPHDLYKKLYKEQNGNCLICHKHKKILDTDHCHELNEFRGLICRKCNMAIGLFEHDVFLLMNAISYLNQFTFNQTDKLLLKLLENQ